MTKQPRASKVKSSKPEPKPHQPDKTTRKDNANEETLDRTIEDSFPASDPPSSIPDPDENAA
jgi:hypothetical protein